MPLKRKRILLVSSAGGHFAQLLQLKDLYEKHDYLIITEDVGSNIKFDIGARIRYVPAVSGGYGLKFWMIFLLNIMHAMWLNIKFRPTVIISTGSHTAVPYFLISKLFRVRCIYILSYARVKSKAKSADLLYKFSDLFIVQWEGALKLYKSAKYLGGGLY